MPVYHYYVNPNKVKPQQLRDDKGNINNILMRAVAVIQADSEEAADKIFLEVLPPTFDPDDFIVENIPENTNTIVTLAWAIDDVEEPTLNASINVSASLAV